MLISELWNLKKITKIVTPILSDFNSTLKENYLKPPKTPLI